MQGIDVPGVLEPGLRHKSLVSIFSVFLFMATVLLYPSPYSASLSYPRAPTIAPTLVVISMATASIATVLNVYVAYVRHIVSCHSVKYRSIDRDPAEGVDLEGKGGGGCLEGRQRVIVCPVSPPGSTPA